MISTVPRGVHRLRAGVAAPSGAWRETAYEDAGPRTATWSSSPAPARTAAKREPRRGCRTTAGRSIETAPAVGVLQGHDPAEAPELRLGGASRPVAAAGGDGAAGDGPQAGADPGVAEGLHQGDGAGEPGGRPRRVAGAACSSRASSETTPASSAARRPRSARSRSRSASASRVNSARDAEFDDAPRRPAPAPRRHPSPTGPPPRSRARRPASARQSPEPGRAPLGERLPGDPVAPAVDGRPLAPLLAATTTGRAARHPARRRRTRPPPPSSAASSARSSRSTASQNRASTSSTAGGGPRRPACRRRRPASQ